MRQEIMGFRDAVASAGPYANNLHLATDNHTNTSSLLHKIWKKKTERDQVTQIYLKTAGKCKS